MTALVIEDHDFLRQFIKKVLTQNKYDVLTAESGKEALDIIKNNIIDFILLDLNLGDMHGTEIIKLLRSQNSELPIIVVSNFAEVESKVLAFNLGCDDYLTKPFYKEELLVRIRTILNRRAIKQAHTPVDECVTAGPFSIDYTANKAFLNGKELELSKKLFSILSYFIKNKNQVISKTQLFSRFWDANGRLNENTVSVHIHMLRNIIEENPQKPLFLVTKKGFGFILKVN